MQNLVTRRAWPIEAGPLTGDVPEGVGTQVVSADDETEPQAKLGTGGNHVASKDKGGKSEKKEAKKSLKEKRASKKDKKK